MMNEYEKFWSRHARSAVPYVPGEQPRDRKFIKLNTNENPYGPSPDIGKTETLASSLQLYPDPTILALRKAIAEANGLSVDEIFCGNGSDEILAFAFAAFADSDTPIAFPDITYSFYPVWSDFFEIRKEIFPLGEDLTIDLSKVPEGKGPVVIANPNAPTGIALPAAYLRTFLEEHPDRLLIVDEAYVDFGAESMVPYIHQYPNLLVVQTYSKSRALAGIRLGMVMGQKQLIDAFIRIKDSLNSYTVSILTQKIGLLSYLDTEYFEQSRRKIMATRERIRGEMISLGFKVTDSKANFLWATHPSYSGDFLYTKLREEGILVRHFSSPQISEYLRITVGTDEEMDELIRALKKIAEGE